MSTRFVTEPTMREFLDGRAALSLTITPSFGEFACATAIVEAFATRECNAAHVWDWMESLMDKMERARKRPRMAR